MGRMQRTKGAVFERFIVAKAKGHGLSAVRCAPMQAGNGDRYSDVVVDSWLVEAKHHRRVSVASHDQWTDKSNHVLVYRHNNRRPKVVLDLDDFLMLLRERAQREHPESAGDLPVAGFTESATP